MFSLSSSTYPTSTSTSTSTSRTTLSLSTPTKRPASPFSDDDGDGPTSSRSSKTPRTAFSPPTSNLSHTHEEEFGNLIIDIRTVIQESKYTEIIDQFDKAKEIVSMVEVVLEKIVWDTQAPINGNGNEYVTYSDGFRALCDLALAVLECENGGIRNSMIYSPGLVLETISAAMDVIIDEIVDFIGDGDGDGPGGLGNALVDGQCHLNVNLNLNLNLELDLDLEGCLGRIDRLNGYGKMYEEYWFDSPQKRLEKLVRRECGQYRETDADGVEHVGWGTGDVGWGMGDVGWMDVDVNVDLDVELRNGERMDSGISKGKEGDVWMNG